MRNSENEPVDGDTVLESLIDTVAGATFMSRAQEETPEEAWVLGEDREGANRRVGLLCLCGGERRRGVGSTTHSQPASCSF